MPHNSVELSTLIGSRICHDLISPIGAIGNGLELLLMGMPPSPELSLIAESVENANARVRFFRVAFGKAGEGQSVTLQEINTILRDISKGARITVEYQSDIPPDRPSLRAAFLAVMCLESALPLGGDIVINHEGAAWVLTGQGRRIQMDESLWPLLQSAPVNPLEVSAGQVQFALLPGLLGQLGRTAKVTQGDTSASITF